MDAAVDFVLDQRWGEHGIFSAPGEPADPVAFGRDRARCPAPVRGGDRGDQDPVSLHLEHVRALPGHDRPLPDDGLVSGRPPRRRVLRPLLPARGAAPARALAHARLARRLTRVPTDATLELGDLELELGGVIPAARLAYRTHGTLAPDRGNAILFTHMYSGTLGLARSVDRRRAGPRLRPLVRDLSGTARQWGLLVAEHDAPSRFPS